MLEETQENVTLNKEVTSSSTQEVDAKQITTDSSKVENKDAKQEKTAIEKEVKKTPLEIATEIVNQSSKVLNKKTDALVKDKDYLSQGEGKEKAGEQNQPAEAIDTSKQGDERYDKIPRFQELTKKVKEYEPLAKKQQEFESWKQTYGVNDAEFEETKNFLVALKTGDFNRAHLMMKPVMESLDKVVGQVLPEDLQKAVDDGKVELAYAQELAKARSTAGQSQQQLQRQQQQQMQVSRQTAINSWVENTKEKDPDFADKADMINESFVLKWAAKQDASPAELAAMCQKAYEEVNQRIKKFIPVPKERKLPQQNGSTNHIETEAKTPFDRAMQIANKHYNR